MNKISFAKRIGIIVLIIFIHLSAYSQRKEGYNWYFGASAGLTWNTTQNITSPILGGGGSKALNGLPMPLSGSSMTSQSEGVFAMSDHLGALMFYSDGMTVWNKSHAVMTNGTGLRGHNSSTQSGIIIPYPGQLNKFIAITVGACDQGVNSVLSYSIIDMNSGLGMVELATKNTLLTGHRGQLDEQVAAVKHTNGTDYWIIAPGKGSGQNSVLNVW